jgi:hypothetical protein
METRFNTAISFLTYRASAPDIYFLRNAHHMFSASHKALVDHLGSIVSSSIDVYALLDYRVAACSQRLARLVSAWLYLRLGLRRVRP